MRNPSALALTREALKASLSKGAVREADWGIPTGFAAAAVDGEDCRPPLPLSFCPFAVYYICSPIHRFISSAIAPNALAVSGFSVLKSSSCHSQPCSSTMRRLSG